jgi:L-ascorbate metabolism protein UlaG (beta-lactamase superfamily)
VSGDAGSVRLTHVGGPTTLLEVAGWRILTDPTFDPPGRTYHFGLGTSSTKTTGPAIAVDDVGPLDVVLLTHDHHADNLDDLGRTLLPRAGTVVTTTAGAARVAKELAGDVRGLDPWHRTLVEHPDRPTIAITATPCRHGPPLSRALVGDVVGFSLTWDGQQHGALWISGDTVLYDGVREVASRLDVSVAVLHLGEARFGVTGPVRYTMDVQHGLALCRAVRPRTVVPVHYEGWSHFREGRAAIEEAVASAEPALRDAFRIVTIGDPVQLDV